MFFIRDLPVPIVTNSNKSFQKVIALVSSIFSEYKEFNSILKEHLPVSRMFSNLLRSEKLAQIDAEVAKLYGLSFSNLEYILDQFHIRDKKREKDLNQQKRLILKHFGTNNQN